MEAYAEVKVLIKQSATEVSQDSRLVAATDGKPNTIMSSVGTNSTLIESIVSARQVTVLGHSRNVRRYLANEWDTPAQCCS